jgi:hypothetical protein
LTSPDEPLERARRAAAEQGYEERVGPEARALDDAVQPLTPELLRELAVIEVEPSVLFSTRRFGGPVTLVKRLLLRLMRQYTVELEARQTRFNVAVLARLRELEERIDALDRGRP